MGVEERLKEAARAYVDSARRAISLAPAGGRRFSRALNASQRAWRALQGAARSFARKEKP